jgi:O-antigen/teichoic acid export membrane protein
LPNRLHAGEGRTRGIVRARYAEAIRRVLRSNTLRQSVLVAGATVAASGLNYVFHVIVARMLSVVDYGAVTPLINATQLVGLPATIGQVVVAKYAAEFHAVGDRAKLARLWTTNLYGSSGVGLAAFGVVVLARGWIAAYMQLPPGEETAVVATGALLFAWLLTPGIRGAFQGTQDFQWYAFVLSAEAVAKVAFGMLFVKLGYGLAGAMWGCAAGLWLSNIVGVLLLARAHAHAPERLRLDMRRLVVTMLGIGGSTIVITVLSYADALLVKHYLTVQDAGLFAAVTLVGKIPLFVMAFVPTIVMPRATALVQTGKSPLPALREGVVFLTAIAGGGLLVFGIFARVIIGFTLGAKYVDAAPLVFTYVLAVTFLGALTVVVAYKTGLHRFDFVLPIGLVATAEIVAIALVHPSLETVLRILVAGHALAFVVSLNGVFDGAATLRGSVEEQRGLGLRARFVRRRANGIPSRPTSVEEAS